ncbi:MAG: DUF6653 family protein [Sulfitobacter sp.]
MDLFRAAERMMAMDDGVWLRHANPWSGWSRMVILPMFCLAVWSRVWIGWGALVPIALVLVWIWWNPRAFAPPHRFDAWMTKGVFGERIFIEHRDRIAPHHLRAAKVLSLMSVPGGLIMLWGLWMLWWEGAVFGMLLCVLPKIWFVDRMAWIFDDWERAGLLVPGMAQGETDV